VNDFEVQNMIGNPWYRLTGLLSLVFFQTSARYAEAQIGRGYPTVHNYGNALGANSFGGYGYNIGTGYQGAGYQAGGNLYSRGVYAQGPQTYNNLQGLAGLIMQVPGWNGTTGHVRPRPRPVPTMPREQLLSDDGKILWPSATPDDAVTGGTRRAAEEAVRNVLAASGASGHAPVKRVIAAKNALTDFARKALPIVKTKNAADAEGLERFIVELGKTLQTMAVGY
jgi:hypothetical protein